MNSKRFWDWVDTRQIIRRIVVIFTLVMSVVAVLKGFDFAMVSKFDGLGTAAIITAFTAPVAYLQKAAFDAYLSTKKDQV